MVTLVKEMLRLQKEHAEAEALKEDPATPWPARSCNWTRRLIALVYKLYALTEEEVGAVESLNR
jgi:hypothetical protein